MKQMSRKLNPHHILVIIGPTASGKSSLAIEMARKYDGEIISADSRQIYRGMDIGTGKVERDSLTCLCEGTEAIPDLSNGTVALRSQRQLSNVFLSEGIPHHLIDICEPNEDYNVTDFKHDAQAIIKDIQNRGKLPIICGGTLFWVQALIDNQTFPAVPPNPALREQLSNLSPEELLTRLKTLDPKRAETIDTKNPIRLIRAIEIATTLGSVPVLSRKKQDSNYFIIAINPLKEILNAKIQKRLSERFDQGMIEEVRNLHNQGISFERLESFGLEYRWIALYLQEKIDAQTMKEKLYFDIIHYAKRQLTWLRRWEKQGAEIHWIQTISEIDTLF